MAVYASDSIRVLHLKVYLWFKQSDVGERNYPPCCLLKLHALPRTSSSLRRLDFQGLMSPCEQSVVFRMWPKDTKGRQTEDLPPHFNQHFAGEWFFIFKLKRAAVHKNDTYHYFYTFHIPEQIRLLMWFSEMHEKVRLVLLVRISPLISIDSVAILDSRTPFGKYTRKMGLQWKHIAKAKSCFELSMQWHPIQFFDRIEI